MSYQDERENQMDAEITQLQNLMRQLRQREKSVKARAQYIAQPDQFQYNDIKKFRQTLSENLNPNMMPANVGGINEVAWPFYFQVQIDVGTAPSISTSLRVRNSFQVDQEASLILMSISRMHDTNAAGVSATLNAPLQMELIDRQSSRRFNNAPIPIQMIGDNSNPSVLPTGMLLMPNAFLDVEVSGIPTVAQAFAGSGVMQFSFFGYRTRIENAQKVLSTIFG